MMLQIEDITAEQLSEAKLWLFKENVRIEQEKLALEDERKAFEEEKRELHKKKKEFSRKTDITVKQLQKKRELFEKQWNILERELRRLARDREHFEQDKALLEREKNGFYRMRSEQMPQMKLDASVFFKGVDNPKMLKKRYRDLLKLFHPDNMCGDNGILQLINKEYDVLSNSMEKR